MVLKVNTMGLLKYGRSGDPGALSWHALTRSRWHSMHTTGDKNSKFSKSGREMMRCCNSHPK